MAASDHDCIEHACPGCMAIIRRLRQALERLLKESEVPAFYGPGSAWNQALNALDGREGDE